MSQRNVVELKKPPFLTTQFFNTLQAGADVVTMSAHCPYIYEVAFKLVELFPEENMGATMEIFQAAFIQRFSKIILDYSTNARESDTQS